MFFFFFSLIYAILLYTLKGNNYSHESILREAEGWHSTYSAQKYHPYRVHTTNTEDREGPILGSSHPRRGATTMTDCPRRGFKPLRNIESKNSHPIPGHRREKENLQPYPSQGLRQTLKYIIREPNKDIQDIEYSVMAIHGKTRASSEGRRLKRADDYSSGSSS